MKAISSNSVRDFIFTISMVVISINLANGQLAPNLAPNLEDFALFTAAGAFNNGGTTVVTGDIGSNTENVVGFPPGTVIGDIHDIDGVSAQAAADVMVAYMYLDGLPAGPVISSTLDNQVLTPDLYTIGAATILNAGMTLTLDAEGDPDALFFFQIDGALSTGSLSEIVLINGTSPCNVYWQINGAVNLGPTSVFQGIFLNNGAISMADAATLLGQGLSTAGAIELMNNVVMSNVPPTASVITAGGQPTEFCEGGSVTLSGNLGGVWNTGETTASIDVSTSGTYFVTNKSICGDSVVSNSIVVTVYSNNPPVITADGAITFCLGGSVELTSTPASSYLWSTGETTQSIIVTMSGMYSVMTSTLCGDDNMSNVIEVMVSSDIQPTITPDGPLEFCLDEQVMLTSSEADSYLWNTGETSQSIIVTMSGMYSVTTTPGDCVSDIVTVTVDESPLCGAAIPTLGQWSLILLGLLFLISGVVFLPKKVSLPEGHK